MLGPKEESPESAALDEKRRFAWKGSVNSDAWFSREAVAAQQPSDT
jgi:hypothetical protein